MVQAHRTYTKHTSTEIARCVGYLFSSSGWLKHIEPPRTYTNHTITELARCVGCFCTRSGGSSTSNLHEPHHHNFSKLCLGCLCTSSGWFKHSEPTRTTPSQCSRCVGHSFGVVEAHRTSSNLQETHHHSVSKVCRVLMH